MKYPFTFLLLVTFVFQSYSQGEANIWYFGRNAGVDFNGGTPVGLTNGALNTGEGCATISDKNGNLIFYTDGIFVYNRNHQQMPNGFGLFGDPSAAQSAIIVPQPGSNNRYVIFTVDAAGGPNGFAYSEVDMTLDNGMGDVIAGTKNTVLFSPSVEKLTAVKHANGLYVWVLGHGLNNNRYYAYLVDCDGVAAPVVTDIGSVEGTPGWGCLVASPNGLRLASAMRAVGFEVYDFDPATGIVTNPINLGNAGSCYGVSFSPNNNLLYGLSIQGGQVLQWNLLAGTPANIIASVQNVGVAPGSGSNYNGGALQQGPDGKLYIPDFQRPYLTAINNPNVIGVGCDMQAQAVDLLGRSSWLGLPPFIQSFFDTTLAINYSGTCIGSTTDFLIGGNTTFFDSVYWHFDDPASGSLNSSTLLAPSHEFTAPGIYNVQLIKYLKCINDTSTEQIEILSQPVYNQNPSICENDSFALPDGTYAYSAGVYNDTLSNFNGCDSVVITTLLVHPAYQTELYDTICEGNIYLLPDGNTANSSGTYVANLSTTNGCDSVFTVNLTVNPIYTDSISVMICDNESYNLPDGRSVSNQGIYNSMLTSVNDCDSLVVTTLIINPTYQIDVFDTICAGTSYILPDGRNVSNSGNYTNNLSSLNACDSVVNLILTVFDPEVNISAEDISCKSSNDGGAIATASNSLPPYDYQWSNQEITSSINNLPPGIYTVSISDGFGCIDSSTVEITEPDSLEYTSDILDVSCYENEDGQITVNPTGGTEPYTLSIDGISQTSNMVDGLAPGTYNLELIDANNCSRNFTIEISRPDSISYSYEPVEPELELGDTIQLFTSSNYDPLASYAWVSNNITCNNCNDPLIFFYDSDTLNGKIIIVSSNQISVNCEKNISIFIDVDARRNLFFPNAFSPNGDGNNETYHLMGNFKSVRTFSFQIFDRWGKKVFETDKVDFEWSGDLSNGEESYTGVYSYNAVYSFLGNNQKVQKRKGSITLLR